MPVKYVKFIRREDIQADPDVLWCFGDNLAGVGLGGQAKECRGEPNAVGIPTKRLPSMEERAFFRDADLPAMTTAFSPMLKRLHDHLQAGGTVHFPVMGVGTGFADLRRRAPAVWAYLRDTLAVLGIENPKSR